MTGKDPSREEIDRLKMRITMMETALRQAEIFAEHTAAEERAEGRQGPAVKLQATIARALNPRAIQAPDKKWGR